MAVARWLDFLGTLLRPWWVLAPAMLVLGCLQGLLAQAPSATLLQRLGADGLMLLRAVPLTCAPAARRSL